MIERRTRVVRRWVIEKGTGSRRARRWVAVACWEGGERDGIDILMRLASWGSCPHRWWPLDSNPEAGPTSYEPFGPYDKGEFD